MTTAGENDALQPGYPAVQDRTVKSVLDVWRDCLFSRNRIPRKAELLPFRIARSLSAVWLYRHLPRQQDFECRVIGEDVLKAWPIRLGRGDRMSQLTQNDFYAKTYPRWRRVVVEPCIMHSLANRLDYVAASERLAVPLADDDDNICYLLGVTHFSELKDDLLPINPDMETVLFYDIPKTP